MKIVILLQKSISPFACKWTADSDSQKKIFYFDDN